MNFPITKPHSPSLSTLQAGGPVRLTRVGSTRRLLDMRPAVDNETGSEDDEDDKKVEQANHAVQEIFF